MPVKIRKLVPADLAEFKHIRLEALQTNPESFGSNYAREMAFSDAEFLQRIEQRQHNFVLGAFDNGQLTSTVGIYETKNIVNIWGVYTTPQHRGKKLSKNLIIEMIEIMTGETGLTKIRLGRVHIYPISGKNGTLAKSSVVSQPLNHPKQ